MACADVHLIFQRLPPPRTVEPRTEPTLKRTLKSVSDFKETCGEQVGSAGLPGIFTTKARSTVFFSSPLLFPLLKFSCIDFPTRVVAEFGAARCVRIRRRQLRLDWREYHVSKLVSVTSWRFCSPRVPLIRASISIREYYTVQWALDLVYLGSF